MLQASACPRKVSIELVAVEMCALQQEYARSGSDKREMSNERWLGSVRLWYEPVTKEKAPTSTTFDSELLLPDELSSHKDENLLC